MVAELLDLRAIYLNGMVRMTWRFPVNAPETVHIYGVRHGAGEVSFDPRFRITRDLRDCSSGIAFEYSGVSDVDVKKITFCVFLAERNFNSPDIRAFQSLPGCFVSVIIGRAYVRFSVKSKVSGGDFTAHMISVRSSSTFDAGILGYAYDFNGKYMVVDLPGRIPNGVVKYPPIYLLRAIPPPVVFLIGGTNNDVIIAQY